MPGCSLPDCKNRTEKGHNLFRIPKDVKLCNEWVNFNLENTRLCQEHFIISDDGLTREKVPTIYNGYVSSLKV